MNPETAAIVVSCIAMTFQYLTLSCIPAVGHVYDISRYDTVDSN